MTLHPILSELSYIWGKLYFLFYQCIMRLYIPGGEGGGHPLLKPVSIEIVKEGHTTAPPPHPFSFKKKIHLRKSHKRWVVENNKTPAQIRHGLATWMSNAYVVVPCRLLHLNVKLSSRKLVHLAGFWFINVSPEPREEVTEKPCGPLLLFEYPKIKERY